jgi:hypothetical protein
MMSDIELNRIIEETFQNIVRNEGPAIFTSLSNFVHDISNIALSDAIPPRPTVLPVPTTTTTDSSNNELPTNDLSTNDLLDDFSRRWFQQLTDYHSCMRDYNKNVLQMNRITNNLLINIVQPIQPRFNPFLQPAIEIQGFSIPLRQQEPPVETYPNISQILAATEVFEFTEEHRLRGLESRCPISLEDFVVGDELCEIRNCHHIFKWTNLQYWFSRHSNCPVCRFDIRGNVL